MALSGGADSLALLHLFVTAKANVRAAHCNFNLRGAESDSDERFVVDCCKNLGVPLFRKSFDTKGYAKKNGISIEMAARELRYGWFNELLTKEKLDRIATGHHKDDNIETFFINLIRGTGIKGLSGIKPAHGNLIRPLLGFTRTEIEQYCVYNKLNYRTDSTNLESVYMRNKVRHQILPLFKDLNPSFMDTMKKNMNNLSQVSSFFQATVEGIKSKMVVEQDGQLLISLKHVNQFADKKLVLFEILNPYGFNGTVVNKLVECIQNEVSGKQFYSPDYRLIKDRHNIIMLPKEESVGKEVFYIDADEVEMEKPIKLTFDKIIKTTDYKMDKSSKVGQFDADLLNYPLTLRKWQQGDCFKPLGMSNFKKLSDYFIDQKFSLKDKEDVWLLLSGDDIIWVVGHRTDDRYKITPKTTTVAKITF
ncbi:tRNA(Ile)-lysidine synthase [Saccharicrinis carchari]|uniref:tRNA(Ile)-lysidine synthase n=1 Tax=Saccharicrinis carchari TaxID=1168039 RepID=A0A521B317_SACCC|nr:tRNA(Ile)-lysidine synthase [Saccharicrinis carchari]